MLERQALAGLVAAKTVGVVGQVFLIARYEVKGSGGYIEGQQGLARRLEEVGVGLVGFHHLDFLHHDALLREQLMGPDIRRIARPGRQVHRIRQPGAIVGSKLGFTLRNLVGDAQQIAQQQFPRIPDAGRGAGNEKQQHGGKIRGGGNI